MKIFNIAVCASGGGGNFQALIDAQHEHGFCIELLVVDRECGAIARAKAAGIPVARIAGSKQEIGLHLETIFSEKINLIVLAGFMPIIPRSICEKWKGKMINTHPSLLPKYGGKGMYGVRVQEAVMAAGEKYAGCTVHYVNSKVDGGEIILQASLEIDYNESPWQLGGRVFIEENKILVEAIKLLRLNEFSRRPL